MSIVNCFSSRLYGLRNYRTALKKALTDEHRTPDTDQPDA
jgi:putative resolvase